MTRTIDILLLLALPASGKSEVRKYLASLTPDQCRNDLRLGPTVQLDDFPYVHLMRRADDILHEKGHERIFFAAPDRSFRHPEEWGTLIELVNDDHANVLARRPLRRSGSAAERLLSRIDSAAHAVGLEPRLALLPHDAHEHLVSGLEREAEELERDLERTHVPLDGKTLVIEFARGGPAGSSFPLAHGLGYGYSLACLSPAILAKARILYVWVTPEESRRKNRERANPNDPGSILHHGVPEHVMLNDYGTDDIEWLLGQSDRPGTVRVSTRGQTYHLPLARFDNRKDLTTFVRNDRAKWKPDEVKALHDGLAGALKQLVPQG